MIAAAIRELLRRETGDMVTAAFIYGSVAAGTATSESDVDCMLITRNELDQAHQERVRAAFTAWQREWGYRPDPVYPVEVFSAHACRSTLAGQSLRRILTAEVGGDIDPAVVDSDEAEILRALLDHRIPVVPSAVLDELTGLARETIRQMCPPAGRLAALGIPAPSVEVP